MIKRKKLPIQKHEGLCIYCSDSKCRKYFFSTQKVITKENGEKVKIEAKCKKDNTPFSKCKSFQKHKFMARFQLPNTRGTKTSKIIEASSYLEAVKKTIEFKDQIQNNLINNVVPDYTIENSHHVYLHEAQIKYLEFLANINVPEHEKVHRSEKHIEEQYSCLKLFNESLAKNRINKKTFLLNKVSKIHVGHYHNYLLKEKKYANKTYNNKIGSLKGFMNWAIENYELKITNPFDKVRQRSTKTNIQTISKKEFFDLINPENMNFENGAVTIGKKKTKRNLYREYLSDGIQLCLHTGARREEVVELQWNMVHEYKEELSYIEFNNLKVERMLGEGFNDNVQTNIIPITKDLKKLLLKLGYEKYKGSNRYIICPERNSQSTQTIMDNLSKGFTHFYKRLNTGRTLQLKCLRKTYLTYLKNTLQGDMKKLDSHSTSEVLEKHYIDQKIINKAVSEMTIFGSEK